MRNTINNCFLLMAVLMATASLLGCGFKLRGHVEMAPELANLYLAGQLERQFNRDLKQTLTAAGITIMPSAEQATSILEILSVNRSRRVLSVSNTASVKEYELRYQVVFRVLDKQRRELLRQDQITLLRDYQFDENNLLSTRRQEEVLHAEMRRDAIQFILRRLSYIKTQNAS